MAPAKVRWWRPVSNTQVHGPNAGLPSDPPQGRFHPDDSSCRRDRSTDSANMPERERAPDLHDFETLVSSLSEWRPGSPRRNVAAKNRLGAKVRLGVRNAICSDCTLADAKRARSPSLGGGGCVRPSRGHPRLAAGPCTAESHLVRVWSLAWQNHKSFDTGARILRCDHSDRVVDEGSWQGPPASEASAAIKQLFDRAFAARNKHAERAVLGPKS
jgi:hypothetical protein